MHTHTHTHTHTHMGLKMVVNDGDCSKESTACLDYLNLPSLPVPGQVHSISGFTLSSTSVELSWTPPLDPNGNITGYHIEYLPVTENGTHDNREVNITTPAVSYTVTGLEENTLYRFTVSAKTSAGRGERSTVSVRTSIDREFL